MLLCFISEYPITFEELQDLEHEFEEAENEIMRQQIKLTKPLYEKRAKTIAQIPNFWPLVLEQAPQEIDQYIQPTDSQVLSDHLTNISVEHFEADKDPRSMILKFEFSENEYFEDKVIEKKFWHRQATGGWAGLVSEPVAIKWKSGKDLTGGLLDLVVKVWQEEKTDPKASKDSTPKKEADYTASEKELKEKIESTGMGGASFFSFFGYRGFHITPEESVAAIKKADEERKERAAGKKTADDEEEEDEDDDEEDPLALEIFADGDELAVAIAEDLYPSAIKYYIQAQEMDGLSELDFEEMDEDDEDEDDE
ncbi:uncharacterized protein B0I36DRAFT_104864 [Microdochium trichocladiopsis]|uniref:Nucleosome assembly protein n=1 Tax=Microdochium trichocladiopsis TaxID=1682393 RepID=A0A9P8YB38_9PEZI|nr:uncharacterized protein B0I36DRAFT_104864 [Microdochium trichocladiopsis]KAH7033089.1 hypothetical protein B0I36DRAFT_104864 [Microdochium trichocladiopsis]